MSKLPELSSEYPISAEQSSRYLRDGNILCPAVATQAEIAAWRPVIVEGAMRHNRQTKPLAERDAYGKAFLQITNLWEKDPASAPFVLAKRFAKVAADLLGVKSVRLYHDQALFKEAGGGKTPWHQDQYYWPLDTDKTITMWMPLLDCSEEMGTMQFASGSDKAGYLGNFEISEKSEETFRSMIQEKGYTTVGGKAMRAGDATFHSGWVLHAASGNSSQTTREAMTIIFYDAEARVSEPKNDHQKGDLAAWLPGLKPGDLAASPLNPVLYSRS